MTPISEGIEIRSMRSRKSGRPASHAQPGFTLLELMVVMVLLAIAAALVIPNLGLTENAAFNAQVRRAAATLTYVRRIAIVEGAPRVASFHVLDTENREYDKRFAGARAGATNWVSEGISLRFQDDPNRSAEETESVEITFFPQGGSTGGMLNFIQDRRSAMIRVDPITGRIATAYNGEELDEEEF